MGLKAVKNFSCTEKNLFHIIPIPEGEYYFSQYIHDPAYLDYEQPEAFNFSIAKGAVNYIGQLNISSRTTWESHRKRVVLINPQINDREQDALSVLNMEYPEIMNKYEYKKNIAVKP